MSPNSYETNRRYAMDSSQQRDARNKLLLRFIDQSPKLDVLEGKTLREVVGNEKELRRVIDTITPEEWIELLDGLNGVIRGIHRNEWGVTKDFNIFGSVGNPISTLFPHPDDKPSLLRSLLTAAKKMVADGRQLSDVAVLVGSGIGATHAYEDGNGRTGRFLYTLLNSASKGEDVESQIKLLLTSNSRSVLDNSLTLANNFIMSKLLGKYGLVDPEMTNRTIAGGFLFDHEYELIKNLNLEAENQKLFFTLFDSGGYVLLGNAVLLVAREEPGFVLENVLKRTVITTTVSSQFIHSFVNENNITKIFAKHRELMRLHVEMFFELMATPKESQPLGITVSSNRELTMTDFLLLTAEKESQPEHFIPLDPPRFGFLPVQEKAVEAFISSKQNLTKN